jgi:hypothetical protein
MQCQARKGNDFARCTRDTRENVPTFNLARGQAPDIVCLCTQHARMIDKKAIGIRFSPWLEVEYHRKRRE